MKILFTSIFVLVLAFNTLAQDSVTVIKGTVKNKEGKPVEGANLVIEGSIDGATADEKGYFEFETDKTGQNTLLITAIDYSDKKINLDIEIGRTITLEITLTKTSYQTDEITVTASSFTSGENSRVTLTPLEIARIPGANADLYRAITTFPGSNQVDEGSKIAVRGGDPSEVLTILDGASLYNPFLFDNDYNSTTFSTVNPWGMKGINFSSGGFPARYGNVLSAVLDLQTYDNYLSSGMFLILGLANASLSGVYSANGGRFGASISAGQFFVKPFFELNRITTDYSQVPNASNVGGTIVLKTGNTGLMKLYANYSYNNVGIRNTSPTFDGYYYGKAHNFFTNLKYSFAPTSVSLLNMSLSYSLYRKESSYSILNNNNDDIYAKFRADYSIPINQTIDFGTGVEYEYTGYNLNGTVPLYFYNLKENAPFINIDYKEKNGRFGTYAEGKFRPLNDLLIVGGVRGDYYSISEKLIVDPRISIAYRIGGNSFIRAATGIYHQNPYLQNFSSGNKTDIKPEQAVHYILGYEYNRENDYILRIESYYKNYSNLVSYNPVTFKSESSGSGYAKGVDVFLKIRLKPKFNGWISYAYSDSKRKQFDSAPEVSAAYDITHSLSIVGSYNISNRLTVGASFRTNTGKPYTPVNGSYFDPVNNIYIPVYAERNSDRLPVYYRIDLNAQYLFSLFGKFAVAFLALNNLLNNDNLYEYSYNYDYTQRISIGSDNPRIIYFGIGMQL